MNASEMIASTSSAVAEPPGINATASATSAMIAMLRSVVRLMQTILGRAGPTSTSSG